MLQLNHGGRLVLSPPTVTAGNTVYILLYNAYCYVYSIVPWFSLVSRKGVVKHSRLFTGGRYTGRTPYPFAGLTSGTYPYWVLIFESTFFPVVKKPWYYKSGNTDLFSLIVKSSSYNCITLGWPPALPHTERGVKTRYIHTK